MSVHSSGMQADRQQLNSMTEEVAPGSRLKTSAIHASAGVKTTLAPAASGGA
jgi:hypothetical protein